MAAYELLLLNTSIPQIQAAQTGDTYVCPRDIAFSAALTLSAGTANGVPYLNGSKVVTTGSALTFDGTNLGVSTIRRDVDNSFLTLLGGTAPATSAAIYATGPSYAAASTIYIDSAETVFRSLNGVSNRMTLNSSGNLGLGVTPNAGWLGGGYIDFPSNGFIGNSVVYSGNSLNIGLNTYYGSGAWRYKASSLGARRLEFQDSAFAWFTAASGTAGDPISFTQAMTLDASGNLGVGATSPFADTNYRSVDIRGTTGGEVVMGSLSTREATITADGTNGMILNTVNATPLKFYTQGNERARITSGGYFKASDNGTYTSASGGFAEFYQSANNAGLLVNAVNTSLTAEVVALRANRNTTNNSFYAIGYYNDAAAAYKLLVADSGTVTNATGTYGTISDAKMKTDIVDAGSQWSDIKALRFRKFKMKDDPSGLVQLGVVAQEVEQTSPGLVDEHADRDQEGNDLGTTTKSVKTSVLLMKAAVALQEAMARIETLEAEVAALKGA